MISRVGRGDTAFIIIIIIIIIMGQLFTILKVPRRCPLVLQAKVGRKHGEAWGIEEGSMLGSGLLEVWSRGMKVGLWTEF